MNRDIERRLATLESRSNQSPGFAPTPEQWALIDNEELLFLEAFVCDHEVSGNMADVIASLGSESRDRLVSILDRLQPVSSRGD